MTSSGGCHSGGLWKMSWAMPSRFSGPPRHRESRYRFTSRTPRRPRPSLPRRPGIQYAPSSRTLLPWIRSDETAPKAMFA